jgi:hypothetical protein
MKTVGAGGGSLSAQGVVLTIPPGALASDTTITVTIGGTIPSGYVALSPPYTFAPVGTTLQKPATITFTLPSAGTSPTVYWSNSSGAFDALATTPTANGVSASIDHLATGFVADLLSQVDAGVDATVPDDASASDAASDAGTDSGAADAVAEATVDAAADTSSPEASAPDDAGVDSGATADGGADAAAAAGIVVTVDGVVTTFATNQSVVLGTNTTTISADDSASTTHWTIQMVMTGIPQEACQLNGNPYINYTHYTNGTMDSLYSSKSGTGGQCIILLTSNPKVPGDHAKGTFNGTVEAGNVPINSPTSHSFASGTFDLTL